MRMLTRLGRSFLAFAVILVLAVACVTVTTGPTSGPGGVPTGPSGGGAQPTAAPGGGGGGGIPTLPVSIPSIAIPSFAIPSLPSFAIPSFEIPSFAVPSFEIPSFEIPSFELPSFAIPSTGAGGGDCPIVSTAKVSAATGQQWQYQPADDPTNCTFIDLSPTAPVAGLSIRTSTSERVAVGKLAFPGGTDLTVAGHPAYWMPTVGILYTDVDPTNSLVVQSIIFTDPNAALDTAQKVATAALT